LVQQLLLGRLMKHFLLCSAALVALTAAAHAADLPQRAAPPAFVAAQAYNWSGLYMGVHVGGGWFNNQNVSVGDPAGATFPAGYVFTPQDGDGFIGGGQAGYNAQFGKLVVGVEGDFSGMNLRGTSESESVRLPGRYSVQTVEANWVGMATARVGYAADNILLYAKGGWAWADVDARNLTYAPAGALVATSTGSETRDGWTIGAGAEWGFLPNWSLKAEYNYIDFGRATVNRTAFNTPAFTGTVEHVQRKSDFDMHLVKVGVNFRM
jgi:outer membrane immunogenic protein